MKMTRITGSLLLIAATLCVFLSSCSSIPEHARYIPKDASVVIGLNTKELGKKVAWNAIVGSKILDRLKEQQSKDAAKGLDKAGIKTMSTMYTYVMTDNRSSGYNRITGLIPLSNVSEWEAYVKTSFPQAVIKTVKDRKEAHLTTGLYAAWNNELLIFEMLHKGGSAEDMANQYNNAITIDSTGTTVMPSAKMPHIVDDETIMASEMDKAFAVTKDNSIVNDKRFATLEKENHDISVWVNYDRLMNQYMSAGALGVNVSPLWKDAALAAGFSFDKGAINGDMLHFVSSDMKEAYSELAKGDVSKELLDRFPAQNVNLIASGKITPKGLKMILEKTGVISFVNIGLMSQQLSFDDISDAFTGEMAYELTDFKMSVPDTTASITMPQMNYLFAMKINKRSAIDKFVKMAVTNEILKPAGTDTYTFGMAGEHSPVLSLNKEFIVLAKDAETAKNFLDGKFKSDKMPDVVKQSIYGHPFGMFMDVQSIAQNVALPAGTDPNDAAIAEEARKLITNVSMNGGEFKGSASQSHITVNFANKDENSLLVLIDFGLKAKEAMEKKNQAKTMQPPVANATPTAPMDSVSSKN
ncbi:DUF4836 family protein [Taibaiella soli]|uniref:DUF4836 family protein n=1 Tax=Taibaiella soli TaxID=1649169 RepID=A0A2W2BHK8_9BACT|nr:DUF4836 family protein [Taibaiella soli]PZF72986.1 hypothetical protein DN068_11285 [Taibaiella soli]